jgi:hypothetical protein
MAENLSAGPKTLGADKGYDTHDFVMELRELGITPHVARNTYETETAKRRSAIDGRTTRHDGYAVSQKKRKRIEEIFGWLKTIHSRIPHWLRQHSAATGDRFPPIRPPGPRYSAPPTPISAAC